MVINLKELLNKIFGKTEEKKEIKYYQYHHAGACVRPCIPCLSRDKCIYYYKNLPPVGEHTKCDCTLKAVDEKQIGTFQIKDLTLPMLFWNLLENYQITISQKKTLNKNTGGILEETHLQAKPLVKWLEMLFIKTGIINSHQNLVVFGISVMWII